MIVTAVLPLSAASWAEQRVKEIYGETYVAGKLEALVPMTQAGDSFVAFSGFMSPEELSSFESSAPDFLSRGAIFWISTPGGNVLTSTNHPGSLALVGSVASPFDLVSGAGFSSPLP